MKIYKRIEQRDGYKNITSVTEKGAYLQYNLWPNGVQTGTHTDEIHRMGWASTADFLRHRPGFVEVAG